MDLRERGYASTLLWRPAHDLVFRPYYRSEDLETLPHVASSSGGILPAIQPGWCIRQDVPLLDPETTRRLMSDAVEGGVERLGLKLDPATPPVMTTGPETGWIGTLLDGLDLEAVSLHLEAGLESIDWLDAVLACDGPAGASPEGSTAAYDPLSTLARTGQYAPRWMDRVGHALDALLSTPHRFLCVGAEAYHEAGANIVEETALLLATLSEYLVQLGDRGSSPAQTLSHCYLSVPVEASHLLSIARLRALRILIPQLLQGFSVAGGGTSNNEARSGDPATSGDGTSQDDEPASDGGASIPIHAGLSRRNMTLYDPHANLLRATTEAASAILGGCDVLIIPPFDAGAASPSDATRRLARNMHHILRHEAHLGLVADPVGGSYYVEALTDRLGRSIWDMFQSIEHQGGLLRTLMGGAVQDFIQNSREQRMQEIARGDRVLVGTTRHADPSETRLDAQEDRFDVRSRHAGLHEAKRADAMQADGESNPTITPGPTSPDAEETWIARPLRPFRDAEAFESLRFRTERHALRTGRQVTATVLPVGSSPASMDRAHRAADLLGCAGFDTKLLEAIHIPEEARNVKAAPGSRSLFLLDRTDLRGPASRPPDRLLVLAGPDTYDPMDVIHHLKATGRFEHPGTQAAYTLACDAHLLTLPGTDRIETLSAIQDRMGMEAS